MRRFIAVITLLAALVSITTSQQPALAQTGLRLQYRAADTNTSDNQIKPHFNIVNGSTASVNMSELKIRYYFTKDAGGSMAFWCDWAVKGCGNISGAFMAGSGTNTDTILEISFTSGAGSIAAGQSSGEIQARLSKSDWTNFNETNDYSFDATKTAFADWNRVVLLRNGSVVWGTAPGTGTVPTNTPGTNPTATRSNPTATRIGATATRTRTPIPGTATRTPTRNSATATRTPTRTSSGGANTMGFIGCSMAENTAQGYRAVGGTRMWGPYGTGSLVVQSWTSTTSSAWQKFDQQAAQFGRPTAVWVQICIFAQNGATYNEVKQMIANARQHAAAGATIYITGQPLYEAGHTCFLAGAGGPELTDSLARQAAADATQNVIYPGAFRLLNSQVSDGCHANTAGQQALGQQAIGFWN